MGKNLDSGWSARQARRPKRQAPVRQGGPRLARDRPLSQAERDPLARHLNELDWFDGELEKVDTALTRIFLDDACARNLIAIAGIGLVTSMAGHSPSRRVLTSTTGLAIVIEARVAAGFGLSAFGGNEASVWPQNVVARERT
jgi:hypothetical protein